MDQTRDGHIPPPPLRKKLADGVIVSVLVRWLSRSLGVLNIIVLARLLQPGDFGLIAMAMVLYGALEAVLSLSIDAVLIRNSKADDEDFNTAWTIGIIQSLLISGILVASAPHMAVHFDDARVQQVMYFLALSVVLRSFVNVGLVNLRKELQFFKSAQYTLVSRVLSILVTIALAFYFRNYVALALGMICGSIIAIFLSYIYSPYRPRLSLSRFRALWSYSGYMALVNSGMYLAQSGDRFIVGGYVPATELGLYSTSADLAEVPTTELVFPISNTIFPGFAKLQHDRERLKSAFLNVVGFIAGSIIPVGLGLSLIAHQFVAVFFGDQWLDAGPLLSILAAFAVCRAIYIMPRSLLITLGHEKLVALMAWVNTGTFLLAAYFAMEYYDLFILTVVKTGIALIYALVSLVVVAKIVEIKRPEVVRIFYRPIISAAAMVLVVTNLHFLDGLQPLIIMLLKILIGSLIYVCILLTLWKFSGKPQGFESNVLELIKERLNSRAVDRQID